MEPGAQVSGLGSTVEDKGPSLETSRPPPSKAPKHSTPQEAAPSLRRRPLGRVPYRQGGSPVAGSPVPTRLSWSPPSSQAGLSSAATFRASGAASGWPAPNSDPRAPEEDLPAPASVTWRRQQEGSHGARSRPPHSRLPGIPNTTGKRRRDPKELAAVMERVRQWETRLLRDIEEATWHELTVEDCILVPGQEALPSEAPTAGPPSTCL